MKKSILMLSALCMLIVASCKKDKTDDKVADCLLTESTYTGEDGHTRNSIFTYNTEGKVIKVKGGEGGPNDDLEVTYTYSNSKIIEVQTQHGQSFTITYTLDGQGRIVHQTNEQGYVDTYIYNAEGYLVEIQGYNADATAAYNSKYSYTNGNLTSIDSGNSYTINYIYGAELANDNFVNEEEFPFDNVLRKFFGKTSKNLVSKLVETSGSGNPFEETYTYEKDANGNITKVSALSNDGDSYTMVSKYTCK
ncbi:DUF4595 domain-containing protein [Pedobacter hiemivivus]|uniref:DUF4595 domain-containing protein n=2 Tax=Pedobacter hiemivivus TaxID=2530454 RepID=A0A4R0NFY3_9SPHI|nr:DUF4595 domain-containing protein [Pedobacter hiemivivus]